jgi:3-isopropylmalate dehydratase small subunit
MDYGFRTMVSTESDDIFQQNALKNGALPIALARVALAASGRSKMDRGQAPFLLVFMMGNGA